MKTNIENKLDKIAKIWNHFIWEYNFCNRKIKFTKEVKTNYFGDILGYFQDTFDIIFDIKEPKTYSERFSYNISLLQVIYIQQDFIEELLQIFKCKIDKGNLKGDANYTINREIRNELIGHPIRRIDLPINNVLPKICDKCGNLIEKPKMKSVLLSSTTFGYDSDNSSILYLRYHKDNGYKFEKMSFKISEIVERHEKFLDKYFDKILNKLQHILIAFVKEVDNLEQLIEKKDFETVIKVTSLYFESIFKSDYIYDQKSLIEIYNRRNKHIRYENFIRLFYQDLKDSLKETKLYVKSLFEPIKGNNSQQIEKPIIKVAFVDSSKQSTKNKKLKKVNYHYELGNLHYADKTV